MTRRILLLVILAVPMFAQRGPSGQGYLPFFGWTGNQDSGYQQTPGIVSAQATATCGISATLVAAAAAASSCSFSIQTPFLNFMDARVWWDLTGATNLVFIGSPYVANGDAYVTGAWGIGKVSEAAGGWVCTYNSGPELFQIINTGNTSGC